MDDSLEINFGDVLDMRDKLPQAREILRRKDAKSMAAQQEAHRWRTIVSVLVEAVSGAEEDSSDDVPLHATAGQDAGGRSQDAAGERDHMRLSVEVLNREGRPMRSREIADILRGQGIAIENSEVSNALYYAANRASPPRVRKMPERGVYAPLRLPHPITDYRIAADLGLPVTDRLPDNDDPEGRA